MTTEERYCTECGRPLLPTDKFCSGCGAMVKELDASGEVVTPASAGYSTCTAPAKGNNDLLQKVMILSLIWGVFALVIGVSDIVAIDTSLDAMIEQLKDTPMDGYANMWEFFLDNGIDETFLRNVMVAICAMFVISGATAIGSAVLDYQKKNYTLSLVLLIISTITAALFLITLIVGILVCNYLSKCKGSFES